MSRHLPELPDSLAAAAGGVSPAECRAAGLSRRQLRRAGLVPVHRGLWVPEGSSGDLVTRCAVALRAARLGSAISHATAVELRDLPMPLTPPKPLSPPEQDDEGEDDDAEDAPDPIHVSVPWPAQLRVEGIHAHRVRGGIPVERLGSGLLVTRGVRTWLDVAPAWERDDLVALGDAT